MRGHAAPRHPRPVWDGDGPPGKCRGVPVLWGWGQAPRAPHPQHYEHGAGAGPSAEAPRQHPAAWGDRFPRWAVRGQAQGDPTEKAGAGGAKTPPSRTPPHLRYRGTELSAAGLGGAAGGAPG